MLDVEFTVAGSAVYFFTNSAANNFVSRVDLTRLFRTVLPFANFDYSRSSHQGFAMSEAVMTPDAAVSTNARDRSSARAIHDAEAGFDYTPVPTIAPISLAIGVLSLIALISLFGIGIALLGVLIGLAAWRTIAVAQGQYGGKKLAVAGLLLSLVGFVGGIALQINAYRTEIPEGFERVSFNYDISKPGVAMMQKPDGTTGVGLPESTRNLDGKKIFLKGFMYPEQRQAGLKSFLLVKDSGDCCFGGQPAIQDIVGVRFPEETDMAARYYNQKLVSVAGEFRVRKDFTGGSLEPVYEVVATHFGPAKSSF